jgi:membrane dipeptidase
VLRKSISVDVHTHGGTSGITSQAPPNDDLANGMRAGSLAVACLADVHPGNMFEHPRGGVAYRELDLSREAYTCPECSPN